jgi:broad specificity phosphatase PhoE
MTLEIEPVRKEMWYTMDTFGRIMKTRGETRNSPYSKLSMLELLDQCSLFRVERTPTAMKHLLLLIRHGESTWNVEHRLPGQLLGIELTATGRAQAQHLARDLTVLPLSAIISSPLARAVETAEYLAQGRVLPIQLESDLMDIELGHWSGQNRDELFLRDPAWTAFVHNPTVAPEDVETFPEVEERVVKAVERWLNTDATGPLPAFVTHADVIKLLLAHYLGLEAEWARSLWIANASVSVVELVDDRSPRVLTIGWNPQPEWLQPLSAASEQPKNDGNVVGEQNA